jgi:hypothetical protein
MAKLYLIILNPFLVLRPRQFLLKIHDLFDLHQKPAARANAEFGVRSGE